MKAYLIDLTFYEISDEFGKRLLGIRIIVPENKKNIFHEANYGDNTKEYGKQEYSNVVLYMGWPDMSEVGVGFLEEVLEKHRKKETFILPKKEKKTYDGINFEHHYNFSVSEIEIKEEILSSLENHSHYSEEFQEKAKILFNI